jgi:Zn-finger nucleic acid-binding protein
MPHFKCVRCRTRLCSASARADLVFDLCPSCGSVLEPVGEPAEIVGFQSITKAMDSLGGSHEAVAEAIALAAPDGDP